MGQRSPEFTDEEVVSETIYDGGDEPAAGAQDESLHPRSAGISGGEATGDSEEAHGPRPANGRHGGRAEDNGDHVATLARLRRNGGSALQLRASPASADASARSALARRVTEARLKGFEGDPCGACGLFTLVRNGTCLKCVSCGATSGCS
jgi:ribonucleoside-diphosphate reductase alpha chain